jgi:dihydroflavonol-4-reductase
MTTLITGATGYIGSAVVRSLCEKGERIRCLVREASNRENLKGLDVEYADGDIRDIDSIRRALNGCQRVYHLAALYAIWLPNPDLMYQVNEEGTRNLLRACKQAKVQKVVYCSSVAALGAHGKNPANESAVFNLNSTKDHYYISKYRAEQIALKFAQEGLPVVIVNPSNPIGAGDISPTPTGALIISIIKKRVPGYVAGGINLIDLGDCAEGIVSAMQKGSAGEKYILGNRNISIKAYFDLIVKAAGRGRSPIIKLPTWIAVLSGAGYEMLSRVTRKPPMTSASWVRVGSHYSWWDSTKARKQLDLGQRSIEKSLAEAIDWFETNGFI